MNLSLKEINEVHDFADKLASELSAMLGVAVLSEMYSMHDDRRGFYLKVYDKRGRLYQKYASGIHTSQKDCVNSLRMQGTRILSECR